MAEEVTYAIRVNGVSHHVQALPDKTLLMVLRQDLGLTGTKFNCEQGECGACTVLFDGRRVNECHVLGVAAGGSHGTSSGGLGTDDEL